MAHLIQDFMSLRAAWLHSKTSKNEEKERGGGGGIL